ncbi:putative lipoprotein [Malacoplasma penetrans HF-2]|uniref:Lipoprotein n=1 Tax=Malacoplasma penetrans (strain HF-2) TaxID=272633 RepID=Q8EVH4_MALP2|nr:BMP family ABC transporter substrate-binding protein [Malacoplasma penetrans]BAC44380.1 putative lipoprotein [Malacoplasma penetrans HF-2]
MILGKKFLKVGSLLAVSSAITVSVTSCGSPLSFESSVQLIVSDNSSTLADQSFSESSFDGIRDFMASKSQDTVPAASSKSIKENNGLWKRPGYDTISRIASYKYAFEDGSKVIVATGYNQQDGLQQITSRTAENKQFKDSFANGAFVFVDGAMTADTDSGSYDSDPYNVSSVSYRADDGSFLAGISTAVFLNLHQDYFVTRTSSGEQTLGVSSFVGLDLPSTLNFFSGFRLGIHYWNTIMQPLIPKVDDNRNTLPISWVSPSNNYDLSNFVSGSFNANETAASALTGNMTNNGASAIFPIAGPQTALVVNKIASDGSKAIVLGVDTAQENTDSLSVNLPSNGSSVGTGKIIQFSSVKNLKDSTNYILSAITDSSGKYNGESAKNNSNGDSSSNIKGYNGFYGLGWNNVGTLTNAGVGVSNAGLKYLLNPNWNEWKKPDGATSITSSDLTSLKLTDVLQKNVANSLSADDAVIKQYSALLNGTFNTKNGTTTSGTAGSSGTNGTTTGDLNTTAKGIIETKLTSSQGQNGPKNDGSWKIYNNVGSGSSAANDFISTNLSKHIPAITSNGVAVTYSVPDAEAKYVASTKVIPQSLQDEVKKVFFRRT